MLMTKRLEKKLRKLADELDVVANVDWSVGHFDFKGHDWCPLGSLRWIGSMQASEKVKENQIYCMTAYTRIVYNKMDSHNWSKWENGLIWRPNCGYGPASCNLDENECRHKTYSFRDFNNIEEDSIVLFFKNCINDCKIAYLTEKVQKTLDKMAYDF